ncbi:MAG: IclR family transcriptional regulator domain-containing protein, partial [Acetobacteraceae bacterium]
LDTVRTAGIALDREEYLAGVVCMAAPVFDAEGNIRAGIAIQAPAARMPPETIARAGEPLRRAARLLAASLADASLTVD